MNKLLRRLAIIVSGIILGGFIGAIFGSVGGFILGSIAALVFNNALPENHVFWGGLFGLLFGTLASRIMVTIGNVIFPIASKTKLLLFLGSIIGLLIGVMKGILIPNYQILLDAGLSEVSWLPSGSIPLIFIFDICEYVGPYVGMVTGFIIARDFGNLREPSQGEIEKDKRYAAYLRKKKNELTQVDDDSMGNHSRDPG